MSRAGGGQGANIPRQQTGDANKPNFLGLGNDRHTPGDPTFSPAEEDSLPDPEVTNKEDNNILQANQAFGKPPLRDVDLPPRPGYGEKEFHMRTNYFQVDLDTDKELFRYDVKIEPAPDSSARALPNGRKRRQFYKALFEDQPDFRALGQGVATDYANTLITCGRLYDSSLPSKKYVQVYRGAFEGPGHQTGTARANTAQTSTAQTSTAQASKAQASKAQASTAQASKLQELASMAVLALASIEQASSEQRYNVTVLYIEMVSSSELIKYVNSRPDDPSDFNSRLEVVQAMNIIIAGGPNKNQAIFQAGQNKFFRYPRNERNLLFDHVYRDVNLTNGLIAVRGYYSSIRTSTSRVLLNLNAQCSAFYPEINLLKLMYSFVGQSWIPPAKRRDLEEFIQRLRVKTAQVTRDGEKVTREKTVRGFSHKYEKFVDKAGKQMLNLDGGLKMKGTKGADHDYGSCSSIRFLYDSESTARMMSVSDYFRKHYGQSLEKPMELVINCGTDEVPTWIPSERCTVMPGQPYRGTLSDQQTTNMLNVAARGPSENARRITQDGLDVIGIQPESQIMSAFGITVSTKMLSVHARLLPTPSVQYAGSSLKPMLAGWNILGMNFVEHVNIHSWSYVLFGFSKIPDKSWKCFQDSLRQCGMGTIQPNPYEGFHAKLLGHGDDDRNDEAIRAVIANAKARGVRILWVILPLYSAAIYARVNFWADIKYGIHTVCALSNKLGENMTYFANVTHKFNLKLGGVNHRVSDKDLGILSKEPTMVVGIDVTHPAPRSMENAPSTVGMVASVDPSHTRWPGSFRIQKGRQEILKVRKERGKSGAQNLPEGEEVMVENIGSMLEERLKVFSDNRKKLPTNIIIYRDGVSEGQYQAVVDLELKPMQEVCKVMYGQKKIPTPKITLVIVAKRHHTRFYPTDMSHVDTGHFQDRQRTKLLGNPLNGTVVDRGITMQKGWDFYLQSHAALKGTAKPTHYVVLHDEIGLGGGQLETLTHNLCYHYGAATKAVSVCPPAYYADILCERGRCYLLQHLGARDRPPGTAFDFARSPWTGGVHPDLKDSMFYV